MIFSWRFPLAALLCMCLCRHVHSQIRHSWQNPQSYPTLQPKPQPVQSPSNAAGTKDLYWVQFWQQLLQQQQQQQQQQPTPQPLQPIATAGPQLVVQPIAGPSQPGCGQSTGAGNFLSRIIGGTAASVGEFPWQVAIQTPSRSFCGGVIVASKHILTAAHCIAASGSVNYVIGLGSTDLQTSFSIGRSMGVTVSRVTIHPSYDASTLENDIAMIELSLPLEMSATVSAACLPAQGDDVTRFGACVVTGWGATSASSSSASASLQKVVVPIQSDVTCSSSYYTVFTNNRFCAGNIITGGVDSCWGDSGGPLVCQDNGRYFLFGLVSSGVSCALPQYPGIYTEVSHFVTWISQNMQSLG